MPTYTDLHHRIRETINVASRPDDRSTNQLVKFINSGNLFRGRFEGEMSAKSVSVDGGTMSDVVVSGGEIKDAVLKYTIVSPDGAETTVSTDVGKLAEADAAISASVESAAEAVSMLSDHVDELEKHAALTPDMSSVNLKKTAEPDSDTETSAVQIRNYDCLQDEDKTGMEAVQDSQDYRFLVRPENGGPLKYASISGVLSALSAGGEKECGCDVSAYSCELSGDKIATWTNGTKSVDVYSNVLSVDVYKSKARLMYTPFYYDETTHMIVNCFFYVNNELKEIYPDGCQADTYGTYYLHIHKNDDSYDYDIKLEPNNIELSINSLPNTETDTYYKLWTIAPAFVFDWRQCLSFR